MTIDGVMHKIIYLYSHLRIEYRNGWIELKDPT